MIQTTTITLTHFNRLIVNKNGSKYNNGAGFKNPTPTIDTEPINIFFMYYILKSLIYPSVFIASIALIFVALLAG